VAGHWVVLHIELTPAANSGREKKKRKGRHGSSDHKTALGQPDEGSKKGSENQQVIQLTGRRTATEKKCHKKPREEVGADKSSNILQRGEGAGLSPKRKEKERGATK